MKPLRCPNCGGGEFEELPGKRRCVFCGSEFEAEQRQAIRAGQQRPIEAVRKVLIGETGSEIYTHNIQFQRGGSISTYGASCSGLTARESEGTYTRKTIGDILLPALTAAVETATRLVRLVT